MSEIRYFDKGEPVPDWLVIGSPKNIKGTPGTVTFQKDVAVVRVGDAFWVLPVDGDMHGPAIVIKGADSMNYQAHKIDVIIPIGTMHLSGSDEEVYATRA